MSGQLSVVLMGQSAGSSSSPDIGPRKLPDPSGAAGRDGAPSFVPDQILVRYKPGFGALASAQDVTSGGYRIKRSSGTATEGAFLLLQLDEAERGVYVDSGSGDGSSSGASRAGRGFTVGGPSPQSLAERTLREIDFLNTLPQVEYAQPNFIYRPLFVPDDTLPDGPPYYGTPYRSSGSGFTRKYIQWHFPLIKMDHVWEEWNGGSDGFLAYFEDLDTDVVVAVIDTGIARSNGSKSGNLPSDLNGVIISSNEYDFISDSGTALDGDGRDDDATDVGDDGANSSFHGTHVAGTIGAITNNGLGVASIGGGSPATNGLKILPLRVLGYRGGTTADIRDAILYAAGLLEVNHKTLTGSEVADVINMSLGSPDAGGDTALENAIDAARDADVVIVASSGNAGTSARFYPAAFPGVISVGAVDITATRASYSSYGDTLFITAPGGSSSYDLNRDSYIDGVLSTMAEYLGSSTYDVNQYVFYTGTSMAAPHVAAVAALVKKGLEDRHAFSSVDDVENILKSTAIDLGDSGKDQYYGWGMVNAYEAILDGLGLSPGPEVFVRSDETGGPFTKRVLLEGDDLDSTFTIYSIGDGSAITITGINIITDYDADFIHLTPTTGTANPSLQIGVSLSDNGSLKNGDTYTTILEILWSGGGASGSEYFYVLYDKDGFVIDPSEIGNVYVAALDVDSISDTIDLYDVTSAAEGFRYTIPDIPNGNYMIGASTDLDGDGYIFDSGEVWGLYPDTILPEILTLFTGVALENIDFPISDAN